MSPRSVVALCVAAGALLWSAPAAQAACAGSTPASASYADPANDPEGAAPDLTKVTFSLDAACTLTFDPGLSAFGDDEIVVTFIDRDGNPATGDRDLFGTDLITVTIGFLGETLTVPGWWEGDTYRFDTSMLIESAAAPGGFSVPVDQLGIPAGTRAAFRVMSLGPNDDEFDVAPDSGDPIVLSVAYDGSAVVPSFPGPAPEPGSSSPLPRIPVVPPTTATPRCTVPKVKGRTVAAAKTRLAASGCTPAVKVTRRYSNTVRKGRVIATTPRSGARTTKKVKLIVSKGKRPRRAS
ncbi:MAG TPA: PASTA domain-containing protein [Solirubrobacter sp.]|nr:PASTA domain-containing protein [Solirubrobacter sp.]